MGERRLLRIVAFGSSSTEGIGASSPAAAYPARLQTILQAALPGAGIVVLNRGIGGEDADDMARRLPSIIAERPDLVIWQTGSNDPLRDVPVDRFTAETRAGVAAMRAAGIDVMLMEPQYCRRLQAAAGAAQFRDAVRAVGDAAGVPVIRRYDLMQTWLADGALSRRELLAPDGLHMTDGGYDMLARDVAREIVQDAGTPPLLAVAAPAHSAAATAGPDAGR